MKKGVIKALDEKIAIEVPGESYTQIFRYLLPELISNLIIYSLPIFLDAHFIGSLRSTPSYSVLGMTNNLIHWVIKIAEGLSVGTIIMAGIYNGKADYEGVGRVLRDSFWTTILIGFTFASLLYFGAQAIFTWYLPEHLVEIGIPFLRIRALSVLFMFIFFAFVGFLRGIKNTRATMKLFLFGSVVFLVADYCLIFGKCGFPAMGLYGSAIASIVQYAFMSVVAIAYVLCNKKNRKYGLQLFSIFSEKHEIARLMHISWPVVVDKAIMASAYIWLAKMLKSLSVSSAATFCVVKDLERFAFLPAIAGAQIITFLVSNDFGSQQWQSITSNLKKILLITSVLVCSLLAMMALNPAYFIGLFDYEGDFTDMAATVFPVLSIFVYLDLLQIILSGALRGSGNVQSVLYARLVICLGYFVPVSYIIAYWLPITNLALKFIFIYGAFYIGNGLMSIYYVHIFRSGFWKKAKHASTKG
jgi:MATE family multidrug resistance protein